MAAFFDRMATLTDAIPEFLSSHPLSAGRADRIRAAKGDAPTTPALSPDGWAALQSICADED